MSSAIDKASQYLRKSIFEADKKNSRQTEKRPSGMELALKTRGAAC